MTFDKIIKHCRPKDNGTTDLIALLDPNERTVKFIWGNSVRLKLDKETKELESIVGKTYKNIHVNRVTELLSLPGVLVKGTRT